MKHKLNTIWDHYLPELNFAILVLATIIAITAIIISVTR